MKLTFVLHKSYRNGANYSSFDGARDIFSLFEVSLQVDNFETAPKSVKTWAKENNIKSKSHFHQSYDHYGEPVKSQSFSNIRFAEIHHPNQIEEFLTILGGQRKLTIDSSPFDKRSGPIARMGAFVNIIQLGSLPQAKAVFGELKGKYNPYRKDKIESNESEFRRINAGICLEAKHAKKTACWAKLFSCFNQLGSAVNEPFSKKMNRRY